MKCYAFLKRFQIFTKDGLGRFQMLKSENHAFKVEW